LYAKCGFGEGFEGVVGVSLPNFYATEKITLLRRPFEPPMFSIQE